MPTGKYTLTDVAPAGKYTAADIATGPNMAMTPADLGISNPIPMSQAVPSALRGKPTMSEQIKAGTASPLPGSFEGKPENIGQYIPSGPGQVARGIGNIAVGNVARGGHQLIAGAGETIMPVAALTAPVNPAVLVRGLAGGAAGSYLGGKLGDALKLNPDRRALISDVGGLAGGYAGTDVLPKVGEAMQSTGGGIINRTAGLLKGDYARGANPGKAYFEGGNGPALSMRSLANKAEATKLATGTKLGAAYDAASVPGAPLIPAPTVEGAIHPPIQNAITIAKGPGGNPASAVQYREYADTFEPDLQAATAKGGFTPGELFKVKENIAKNTNWRDQQQVNLNKVRQQNTGAIGGVLVDAVPETGPLNSIYQGSSVLAKRAGTRADTGSAPLTTLGRKALFATAGGLTGVGTGHPSAAIIAAPAAMAVDSVPVRTSIASGLYYGGRGLRYGGGLKDLFRVP